MSTNKLTIVAHIWAKEEQRDLVQAELIKLIAPTLAENECINYDLHQDLQDPNHFLFYENWESRELWQDHMNAAHLAAYMKATEGAVADFKIYEMKGM